MIVFLNKVNQKLNLFFPRLKGGSYEKNVKCVCLSVPGQKNIKGQKNTDKTSEGLTKKTNKFVALYGSKVFGTDE
jgi:hypothetical protein